MGTKPKEYEFKKLSSEEAEQEKLDALVAEICVQIRFGTANPAEGFMVLETCVFAMWQRYNSDEDLAGFLKEFVQNVLALYAMNNIQGGVQ